MTPDSPLCQPQAPGRGQPPGSSCLLLRPQALCWLGTRCRCVATLQGNMLRQLVSSSLQDYLAFFRQHAAVQPLDPQQDQALWSCLPVFDTELVVQDGEGQGVCS